MTLAANRGRVGRCLALSAFVLLACLGLMLAATPRAGAADTLFWDNYDEAGERSSVGFSNLDGSGGGALDLGGLTVHRTEGLAYDSATNRLYIASNDTATDPLGYIVQVDLGSGAATAFAPPGATIAEPDGVALDPVRRKLFWANGGLAPGASIGWANLDGSAGGTLNTAGVVVNEPFKIAVDPVAGRVYWGNLGESGEEFAYANADNSGGGGVVPITGVGSIHGMSIDAGAGRIYWVAGTEILTAGLAGGPATPVGIAPGTINNAYGLAVDPAIGRVYWGNYGNAAERAGAIGFADLAGGGGTITPVIAPVHGPQNPLILKAPVPAGAPVVARAARSRSSLTCSEGQWGADFAGSFVYRAPNSFGFQWSRDGAPVAGASAATLAATAPGSYSCAVTASNHAGSATQVGAAAVTVKKASYKLRLGKKTVMARPGRTANLKLVVRNAGDLTSAKGKLCVTVPKKARSSLKAPKCRLLARTAGGARRSLKLAIKAKPRAKGTHRVTIRVKGVAAKPVKAKIKVLAGKRPRKAK